MRKIKSTKKVTNGTTIHTTDYLDGFQYYNSNLEFFAHAEGYVKQTTLLGFNIDPLREQYSYQEHYSFSENGAIDTSELLDFSIKRVGRGICALLFK